MRPKSAAAWWALLAALLAAQGAGIFYFHDLILQGQTDFASFYAAGRLVEQGQGRELYRYSTQRAFQEQEFPERSVPLLFYHPPFELILFLPLAYLPFAWANGIWLMMNALLVAGLGFLRHPEDAVGPAADWSRAAPRLAAAFGFYPVFLALRHGQDSVMLLWLFCLAYLALRRGQDFAAGCFLGLGLFKFQIVLPFLLVMALRRKWRVLQGVEVTAIVLAGLCVLLVGWTGMVEYAGFVAETDRVQAHGTIHASAMPNLRGLVAFGFGPALSVNERRLATAALSLLLLLLAARTWPKSGDENGERFDLGFAVAVVAALLASYHFNGHDATLLLLPVALALRHLKRAPAEGGWGRRWLRISLVILFLPALHFSDPYLRYPVPVLWAMLVLLLALRAEARRLAGG